MSLRISSAGLLIVTLAACGPESGAPNGEAIDCAIGPGSEYSEACTLEIARSDTGSEMLVIHQPGGGFRRFEREGAGLLPLAGAEPLIVLSEPANGIIEIAVAQDRYRVPLDPARPAP
jgi:hypothetical protein